MRDSVAAGLLDEARRAGERAAEIALDGGNAVQVAEALLLQSRVAHTAARFAEAHELAVDAAAAFEQGRRPAWAAQARYLAALSDSDTALRELDATAVLLERRAGPARVPTCVSSPASDGSSRATPGRRSHPSVPQRVSGNGRRRATAPPDGEPLRSLGWPAETTPGRFGRWEQGSMCSIATARRSARPSCG